MGRRTALGASLKWLASAALLTSLVWWGCGNSSSNVITTGNGGAGGHMPGTGGANVTCTVAGAACSSNAQCCSASCDPVSHTCTSSVTSCSGPGSSCAAATDCCNLQCDSAAGKCSTAASCTADNANCSDCGSTWSLQTAPVGSFKPNAFGLHDVHGNVWEWVEDSWHENYKGAPADGSAWLKGGDPNYRVIRGGSWHNEGELIRVAVRFQRNHLVRFDTLGFRVARTMKP